MKNRPLKICKMSIRENFINHDCIDYLFWFKRYRISKNRWPYFCMGICDTISRICDMSWYCHIGWLKEISIWSFFFVFFLIIAKNASIYWFKNSNLSEFYLSCSVKCSKIYNIYTSLEDNITQNSLRLKSI